MLLADVRSAFLRYMEKEGHAVVPSAPIVPQDDATTLFTGSGMQPLVPYLLGAKHPRGDKVADSQTCFRANDIDEVGDNRHTTFFEMLGNWSLGAYFKEKQVEMVFHFLVNELKLDPNRLYVTVFAGDEEANVPRDDETVAVWQRLFAGAGVTAEVAHVGSQEEGDARGMQPGERIFFYDATKNWWSRAGVPSAMPVGEPGGPDTEVFYDFGEEYTDPAFAHLKPHPNTDSGRFIEICNSVFMEYVRTEQGFEKLPQRNVDFGGGLERLVAATEGDPDVFKIDVFRNVIERLEADAGVTYDENPQPFRIIADHLRSAIFIIADGVEPSNTDRGYVLRRLIRASIYNLRYVLNVSKSVSSYVETFVELYRDQYPKVASSQLIGTILAEEERFSKTLERGKRVLDRMLESGALSGQDLFMLQSTYGFPKELSVDLANRAGATVRSEGYEEAMKAHRADSRAQTEERFKGGLADSSDATVRYHTATHLLHQALRDVLGDHVEQRGSNITPERLRFDFSHGAKLTDEERARVEGIVNEKIKADLPVLQEEMRTEDARAAGAIGIFEYGDVVSVYSIGDYSKEFCGGPHVTRTGEIGGVFRIAKEESVSSGVRRIKATVT